MKKIFLLALLAIAGLAQPLMAQEKAAYVYRFGNKYMYDGVRMNEREYAGLIKNTCPEAFKQYQDGHRLAVAGWCMLVAGLAMDVAGAATMGIRALQITDEEYKSQRIDMAYLFPDYYKQGEKYLYDPKLVLYTTNERLKKDKTMAAGAIIEGIGSAALITSVPLLVVGYVRIHNSANVFNEVKGATPYISLNAASNGLGLALNF